MTLRKYCGQEAPNQSIPSWMSPDQWDPCLCNKKEGHAGDHGCGHEVWSNTKAVQIPIDFEESE